ncbi:sacsin N-terminal ATP-binding-like domain-containing protein [Salisediminibacterium beveridgei]|uniref:Histidine kinase-, DNA gyrase B-, and HSP90-like ATPase n=1 Tax=Salisediminibacterium beveridgei TaxID=632773 RepID=A0A1D7QWZ5_9BACI|nr:ATP-binding protein [Salisediminibacterium beveridgei]AOM83521.1 hypothetical protein BBEV_2163 [Salisediminibacterium beveridgei]
MTVSHFKHERDRLLKEVRNSTPGNDALRKLHKLRKEFDSAIDDYRNSLTILGDTTYEDRKHFLLELIQNADDAVFDGEKKFISFSIHHDSLEITYNENGFTTNDVISITGTGASTKTANKLGANSFIGEKGIGFKSVFALAEEVHIESGPWGFKLHKDNYIVPEALNSKETFTNGTKLRVFFSNEESVKLVADELRKLVTKQLESFLFLQTLKVFEYQDLRDSHFVAKKLSILPNNEHDTLTMKTYPDELTRDYYLYEEDIEFPGELVGSRWERLGTKHTLRRKIAVAALETSAEIEPELGRLFCYLPTEVKLPIPIFLQIDGHLKADRERLLDVESNSWNRYLVRNLPDFLIRTILSWRKNENLSKVLPNYVPDYSGSDQLCKVFERVIKQCKTEPWVKTYDGWESPERIILAKPFWYKWFDEYLGFRERIETILGKKFMYEDWALNSNWKQKWNKYHIESLNWTDLIKIFRFVKLPTNFFDNSDNITTVYSILLKEYDTIKHFAKKKYFIENLNSMKIYPFSSGEFKSMKPFIDKSIKIYWMRGRTKRTTGIEGATDIELIDPEYTYNIQISSDFNQDRKQEAEKINDRNLKLRQLLRYIGISELTETKLISDIQVPFLLNEKNILSEESAVIRIKVFLSMFEVFQSKTSFDQSYLDELGKLSNALMYGTKGGLKKLNQLILPENLRFFNEDFLYSHAGMESLKLPDTWYEPSVKGEDLEERKKIYFRKLRSFLLHCGVANGPQFHIGEIKYDNAFELKKNSPGIYSKWIIKNKNDYTHNNIVTLVTVTLDSATQQFIKHNNVSKEIADGLYNEWLQSYFGKLDNIDSNYYRYNPPPGFIKFSYKRREEKKMIVRDELWAGLEHDQIPLLTLKGQLTNAGKAFKVNDSRGLGKSVEYFDLVLNEGSNGYHSFFLDTLNVKSLSIEDINKVWLDHSSHNVDDLLQVTYELSHLNIDFSNLRILDKDSNKLRPINHFKLGKSLSKNTPYIEEQYGEMGKKLGQKLKLLVESEVAPLLDILNIFYLQTCSDEWVQSNMMRLLIQIQSLQVSDKSKLIQHINSLKMNNNIEQDTLILFNEEDLYKRLKSSSPFVIHLSCTTKELYLLKKAAKDIGFKLIEDTGTIQSSDSVALNENEEELIEKMLDLYAQELEQKEAERFYGLLTKFGGQSNLQILIFRTKNLEKVVSGIKVPLAIPYFDTSNESLYIQHDASMPEISARLLSIFGFTTYRSAIRDFKDLYVTLRPINNEKEKATQDVDKSSQQKKSLNSTSKDMRKPEQDRSSGSSNSKKFKSDEELIEGSKIKNNEKHQEVELTMNQVLEQLSDVLAHEEDISISKQNWKLALDPEDGERIRNTIRDNLQGSLKDGPEIKEIKERKKQKRKYKIIDQNSQHPKEFLLNEYDGRCQICETQLIMANGKKYFDVYRIKEAKDGAWWKDRPFNTLCLCPNCNALAKHGGSIDLTLILHEAELLIQQETFPQEVEAYNGDFFVVTITHNSEQKQIVLSNLHLEYFAALLENVTQ